MTPVRVRALILAAGVAALVYFSLGPEALGPLFLGVLFGTIGVVLTRFGYSGLVDYDRRQARAARAEGVVTEIRLRRASRRSDVRISGRALHDRGRPRRRFRGLHPPASAEVQGRRPRPGDVRGGRTPQADIAGTEWIGILAVLGFGLLGLFAAVMLLADFAQRVGRAL
jgi:hypothetical protein